MSRTTLVVVGLAVLCGLAAMMGVNAFLNHPSGPGSDQVMIVVAAANVSVDTKLTAAMLTTKPWPREAVPTGALTKIESALDRDVCNPLVKDLPVLNDQLMPKGSHGRMAAMVPPGMRSVSILVPTQSNSVAGFVRPGNRVDVLLTISDKGVHDPMGGITKTLLENIEVLGVDQYADAPPTPAAGGRVETKDLRSVTLLVTPEQSMKLIRGQDMGKLHLTLRNPNDTEAADAPAVTGKSIRSPDLEEVAIRPVDYKHEEKPRVVPAVAAVAPTIHTLRGPSEGRLAVGGD